MDKEIQKRNLIRSVAVFVLLMMSGCSELSTDYGKTKGLTGQSSLNGFGALRNSFENAGYRSRDVSRLTNRVRRSDVIVWTPQTLDVIDDSVTRWFDRWLKSGGKTLVYVVPDSGSEADYWTEAAALAPPDQRIEYRKRSARSINQRMIWRLNRQPSASNGWFQIEPLQHRTTANLITGDWSRELLGDDEREPKFATEFSIKTYDDAATAQTPPAVAKNNSGPTGPASPGFLPANDVSPTSTQTGFDAVVKDAGGDGDAGGGTIVAEIRSDDWRTSKIIVVAGGSLLTNFALTHDPNQRLAAKIITESASTVGSANDGVNDRETLLVGFLTSDWMGVSVSETKPGVPVATGMELLTVWPLSLVTMHGAMLGLVICLMLWPILGRPKRVHLSEHTHFGDHLDAVAGLMNRTGGEEYARDRISEYFKRVRGETTGPWVNIQSETAESKSKPLPPLGIKRKTILPTITAVDPAVAPEKEDS
ncbi:hypothetical protein [Rubripirellula reticaptiva]|uniref:DUF4350 domain-containing protein n=1 Tax=Rubripirellula reticaptiva TaxID=2528013 RepID=A0A5C6F9J3_9BACT|nr:hypothetical protein [Rubripirellula reticaptiva]TWU56171.1 hypothetical protein Poly59_24750 [Rubripirellula reticaptiva]